MMSEQIALRFQEVMNDHQKLCGEMAKFKEDFAAYNETILQENELINKVVNNEYTLQDQPAHQAGADTSFGQLQQWIEEMKGITDDTLLLIRDHASLLDEVEALTMEFVSEAHHLINDDTNETEEAEKINQLDSKSKALEEKFKPYLDQFETMEKQLNDCLEKYKRR
jgi:hypothetical protein